MDGVLAGGVEGAAYTASLGQGVPTVSGKCPLAGLFQLVVARVLYDGFKSRLRIKDGAILVKGTDYKSHIRAPVFRTTLTQTLAPQTAAGGGGLREGFPKNQDYS